MATSGVTRGYLRPGFSRSPPFLMIGLIITAGISAFNYWNLSAQYADLVKEITELQDHVHIVTLKRETAEKRVDALQQRLSESGDQLGQMKIAMDERMRQARLKDQEIERLQFEAKVAAELSKSHNASLEELRQLKRELEQYKFNNSLLREKEFVLHSTVIDLKTKVVELSQLVSQARDASQFKVPPIVQLNNDKTGKEFPHESVSVKMSLKKDSNANDDSLDHHNAEAKIDPAFGQFQDTGVEAENNEVKDVNTGHKNQSGDVEGQNGNYDFGLWENRINKEMPADDQLEEDDGGINANKTSLALPSAQALQENPNQIPKIVEVSAVNPLTQSGNKTMNYGMESIRRPQLPTKKSMAPIVQKMMHIEAAKRAKSEDDVGKEEMNSDMNVNVLNKPLLIPQKFEEVMPEEQNIEAPNTPDKHFMIPPSEAQNALIEAKALSAPNDAKKLLNEPITRKVMPFNEVFNNNMAF